MTSSVLRLCIVLKTISFIEKLPFRPYLLCSKPVKPGHYSVLPSHKQTNVLKKKISLSSFRFYVRSFISSKVTSPKREKLKQLVKDAIFIRRKQPQLNKNGGRSFSVVSLFVT